MPGPIQPIAAPILPTAIRPSGAAKPGGFPEMLAGAIRDVESFRAGANASVERFLSGEGEELHTAALAVQRSELAFDLFLQARNKVVQAYQEIMRMQM